MGESTPGVQYWLGTIQPFRAYAVYTNASIIGWPLSLESRRANVDAIVLTGGLANSAMLVDSIADRVLFIAPVKVYPGEQEMIALAAGALRVLVDTEAIQHYGQPE